MHSDSSREIADLFNKSIAKDHDYLDDRILGGISDEIHQACSEGKYSIDYNLTAGLSAVDLRYCKEQLEEMGYQVDVNYENGILSINW